MDSRLGISVALLVIAMAMFVPAVDAGSETVGETIFTYTAQLDENSLLVYKEVGKATSVDDSTRTFKVELEKTRLFKEESEAKTYGTFLVNQALSAEYLSNPMIPYLWNYPVCNLEVTSEIDRVKDSSSGQSTTYYAVSSVTFSLSVPEGITSDSMKQLNDAIKDIKVNGNTDADKVVSMMNYLNSLSFQKDDEGKISNIYDALVSKRTTSAGVAQAFTQLCILNNIPVLTVAGDNIMAKDESLSFWNYVYLEGDQSGSTEFSWYMADASYAQSTGISGYLTEVSFDGKTYSMGAAHCSDLQLVGENTLILPQISKDKYVPVGGPPFLELYGEKLLLIVLGLVVVLGLVYAIRTGNI
jgi:hypothetical protein